MLFLNEWSQHNYQAVWFQTLEKRWWWKIQHRKTLACGKHFHWNFDCVFINARSVNFSNSSLKHGFPSEKYQSPYGNFVILFRTLTVVPLYSFSEDSETEFVRSFYPISSENFYTESSTNTIFKSPPELATSSKCDVL